MIIIPSKKFIDGELPEARLGIEGWFTVRAFRRGALTRERTFKQMGPFHNLLTDLGLNGLSTTNPSALYRYCHVGTGTTAPSVTDTQLANFLANVTSSLPVEENGTVGDPDYYIWRRFTWTSAIGALGTVNLTELCVSGQSTNGQDFSRELFRDGGGNPAAFPITSEEQISITYELRFYIPTADSPATVMVGATSHDTITRARNALGSSWQVRPAGGAGSSTRNFAGVGTSSNIAFSGEPQPFDSASLPTGNLGQCSSFADAAYTGGNFHRDMSATWGTGTGNGNIRTVVMGWGACAFQVRYDPVIAKDSTKQLVLNQRVSWARV